MMLYLSSIRLMLYQNKYHKLHFYQNICYDFYLPVNMNSTCILNYISSEEVSIYILTVCYEDFEKNKSNNKK